MEQYRGLWRIQSKATDDKESRKILLQNNSTAFRRTNQAIAIRNNTSLDEDSNTQTGQLGRIVNTSVPDISPDHAWELIKPMSSSVKRVVMCLKGDLKRDRIGGITVPLYCAHR